ncbi:MAG: hypothetical protein AAGF67_09415 [Verrucomicrobiota bacterium]
MRRSAALLLSLTCILSSPAYSAGEELIRIRTTVYELSGPVGERASQSELAKLAESVQDDSSTVRFDATTLVREGRWFTARKGETLIAPKPYEKAQLYRGTADERVYSIEDTGVASSPETIILPSQATELESIELGTTFRLKASRQGGGGISLDGTMTESVLVDLQETNENPVITVSRKQDPSRQIELTTDSRLIPLVEAKKVSFSGTSIASGKTLYAVLSVQPSCLSHTLPKLPKTYSKGVTTREYLDHWQGDVSVPIYPPRPDEEITLLVALTPEFEKVPSVVESRSSGNKIYLTSRMVEFEPGEVKPLGRALFSEEQFQILVRELSQKKSVDLLSAPSVITHTGQEANVEAGREFLYPIQYPAYRYDPPEGGEGFAVSPSNPEFAKKRLGAQLKILPRILSNGLIELETHCEVSDFKGFLRVSNPSVVVKPNLVGKPVPIVVTENETLFALFTQRKQETTVRLPDTVTVSAGDLIDIRETHVKETRALGLKSTSYVDQDLKRFLVFVKAQRME